LEGADAVGELCGRPAAEGNERVERKSPREEGMKTLSWALGVDVPERLVENRVSTGRHDILGDALFADLGEQAQGWSPIDTVSADHHAEEGLGSVDGRNAESSFVAIFGETLRGLHDATVWRTRWVVSAGAGDVREVFHCCFLSPRY
jgi:hypothetical protein